VTLTAVAAPGYVFSHWSGSISGAANPAQLTMDSNKNVRAHFVSGMATPTPTATPFPTVTPTPTATSPPSGLWTAPPVSLAAVPSNSQITILGSDAFQAEHFSGNFWMGGGVFAETISGETPIGVIFTWNSTLLGKRMCNDQEFGPTVDARPCAFAGNTSDQLSAGVYCHANAAAGMTANEICQQLAGAGSLGGVPFDWPAGESSRGFGWEQRGNLNAPGGNPAFTVEEMLLIYYTAPTPTPCAGCSTQTPQAPIDAQGSSPAAAPCPNCESRPSLAFRGVLVIGLVGLVFGWTQAIRRPRSRSNRPGPQSR
jgi:hypothetical protein